MLLCLFTFEIFYSFYVFLLGVLFVCLLLMYMFLVLLLVCVCCCCSCCCFLNVVDPIYILMTDTHIHTVYHANAFIGYDFIYFFLFRFPATRRLLPCVTNFCSVLFYTRCVNQLGFFFEVHTFLFFRYRL